MDRSRFLVHGVSLHSAYNPQAQAERFITSQLSHPPRTVLLVGTGFGYLAQACLQCFPGVRVLCIPATPDLPRDGYAATEVQAANQDLAGFLHSRLHPQDLIGMQVLYWKPGCRILAARQPDYLQLLQHIIRQLQMELVTIGSLGRRHLRNSVRNAVQSQDQQLYLPQLPPVLAAPGPSLDLLLPELVRYRSRYCLVAVSSALIPLLQADLVPDLIITADAGHYAGILLSPLVRGHAAGVPVLAYPHAMIPTGVANPRYFFGDSRTLEAAFFPQALTADTPAAGTVTAAAVTVLHTLGSSRLLCAGLDLRSQGVRTHCANHNAIIHQLSSTDRLRPLESTSFLRADSGSAALQTYRDWFRQLVALDASRICGARGSSDVLPASGIAEYLADPGTTVPRIQLNSRKISRSAVRRTLQGFDQRIAEYVRSCGEAGRMAGGPDLDLLIHTSLPQLTACAAERGGIDAAAAAWNTVYQRLMEYLDA
ncbi:6-hydroxymethylpterin diphosphokinase MptE-like protein [Spirochaeta africana]|uniref:6-hydroxymethylpterin diphosphokinase MptE-like domain-containing protein n=1 Tax=Spirochaeta africana (strain ATCC 700263 / DSM 8902 / Z-7692) TaxID=889378 RepID=H9UJ02_SPIAZ|nr:6-hydroxymethylpterin diphosphokinase MptE-like protein [Spirochaeta africana]AFG37495.1 hypothetical protein Spiaf_1432 [Spirochaeta africana DSM 8902]